MSDLRKRAFRWAPGQGPDELALERMCRQFPKPKKAMGEAWFLAPERRMYPELLGDLDGLSDDEILDALRETIGPSCFGPHDEWSEWFHYLLPRLLQREWGPTVYHPGELIISAFVAQHPKSEGEMPYPQFTEDALLTVGHYIMAPQCWPGGVLHASRCLNKSRRVDGTFGWYESSGLLSASLFFCLKYLRDDQIEPWFDSVIAIPNPYWKAQLVVWFIGAHAILTGAIEQPRQFPEIGLYAIGWDASYSLAGNYTGSFEAPVALIPFLPEKNREAALRFIHSLELTEFLEEWQTDPDLAQLAAETVGAPERFSELYGHRSAD